MAGMGISNAVKDELLGQRELVSIFRKAGHAQIYLSLEEYVKNWVDLGKKYKEEAKERTKGKIVETADIYDVFRFMAYWIAMTHMLEVFYKKDDDDEQTERDRIKLFCDDEYIQFVLRQLDYKFLMKNLRVFIDDPVKVINKKKYRKDKYGNKIPDDRKFITYKVVKNDIYSILSAIYAVRNNLVHGDKELYKSRDRNLIESAANLLEGYFDLIFKNEEKYRKWEEEFDSGEQ